MQDESINLYKVLLDRVKCRIGETNEVKRFDNYVVGVAVPILKMVKFKSKDESLRQVLFIKEIKGIAPFMPADNIMQLYDTLNTLNSQELDDTYSKLLDMMLD